MLCAHVCMCMCVLHNMYTDTLSCHAGKLKVASNPSNASGKFNIIMFIKVVDYYIS